MKDKETLIEETAIKLQKMLKEVIHDIEDYSYKDIAKELYKIIIPEDSVVMTETERIAMSVKQWDKGYAQGSKITAEKIYRDYLCDILSPEAKEEFAKHFSVGIKK